MPLCDSLTATLKNRTTQSAACPGSYNGFLVFLPMGTDRARDTRREYFEVGLLEAKAAIDRAQTEFNDPAAASRVLLVCASPRNDGTCPGEMSKSYRLSKLIEQTLVAAQAGIEVDLLDLSLVTSEYGRQIHLQEPCLDGHAAVPLALQLLSESFAWPDQ